VPTTGGTITISGDKFGSSASSVSLVTTNGVVGATLAVQSWANTSITAQMPAGVGRRFGVRITNQWGITGASLPRTVGYAAPAVSMLDPTHGSTLGNIPITVIGSNFGAAGASVRFDGLLAPLTSQTHTNLVFTLPPGVGSDRLLQVTVGGQTSSAVNSFSYNAPVIASISPAAGPTLGGVPITIYGENFGPAGSAKINFQGASLTPSTSSDGQLVFDLPPGGGADHEVTVIAGGQTSNVKLFTYSAPFITTIQGPPPPTTGSKITIVGSNFAAPLQVTVGQAVCSDPQVTSNGLTCDLAAGEGVNLDVQVTAAGQLSNIRKLSYAAPTVTQVVPDHGPPSGTLPITIYGSNFGLSPTVRIGGLLATLNGPPSHTKLVVNPPVAAGVNMSVSVTAGSQTNVSGPGYTAQLTIANVEPRVARPSGGTLITITGGDFTPSNTVMVGTVGWPIQSVPNINTIICAAPPGTGSNLSVVVRDSSTQSPPFLGFTYASAPAVTSVNPPQGPTSGGLTLTINGNNFTGASIATIGGQICQGVTVVNDTSLTCTLPVGAGANREVIVGANGQFSDVRPLFSYLPPSISSISPTAAPTSGGIITIVGQNFGPNGSVNIGAAQAPATQWSHTQITASAPAGSDASAPVVVTTGQQSNEPYPYGYGAPVITSVSTNAFNTIGGQPLTIQGSNFGATGAVKLAGVTVTPSSYSHTQIVCPVPAGQGTAATASVMVGSRTSNTRTYRYAPPSISGVSPNTGFGGVTAGTVITLMGSNFGVNGRVLIGGVDASKIVNYSHTQIQAMVPPGSGYDLAVTVTIDGQSAAVPGAFSYPITIDTVSPKTGTTQGGTPLTIYGENFSPAATVLVGESACNLVPPVTATKLVCTTPPGQGAALDVTVAMAGREATTNGFGYLPPAITSVNPSLSPIAGGIPLTINGSDFGLSPFVTVGGQEAPITQQSHTQIVAMAPRGLGADSVVQVFVADLQSPPYVDFAYAAIGDVDGDGDVDLTDYASFAACLNGVDGELIEPDCASFDGDFDGDVDLADFRDFQLNFTD
jgi:hypothetical protein